MKILRLFINHNLEDQINWVTLDLDNNIEEGFSTFNELITFEDSQVEVYLNAEVCSIFKINTQGLNNKQLTEELLLGIIENNLADEIDEVKPILLKTEDDIAYIATFNRTYYEELISKLLSLNKSIRFVQSFVYATKYQDNYWSLYLNDNQNFVRTSRYEYFILDQNKPIPYALTEMLTNYKPNGIILYTENNEAITEIKKLDIPLIISKEYEFNEVTWNFYNEKSTKFKIKLNPDALKNIQQLIKNLKYLAIFLLAILLIQLISYSINNFTLKSEIKKQLKNIVSVNNINDNFINVANNKLTNLKHARGIDDEKDFTSLFNNFLNVVPEVGTNTITQIIYNKGGLLIFLNNSFDPSQFNSYKNIFATKRINATIEPYKNYLSKNSDNTDDQSTVNSDTSWVIELQLSFNGESENE